MPDDAPPSRPGRAPSHDFNARDVEEALGPGSPAATSEDSSSISNAHTEGATEEEKWHKDDLDLRNARVTGLLTTLDHFICVQICYMYYLEASFIRLAIRMFVQLSLLSPVNIIPPFPGAPPYTQVITSSNLLCTALHLWWWFTSNPPFSPTETRGYIHGGLIVDFIGQKSPPSTLYLVPLDLAIAGLQFFMLAVYIEGERIKRALHYLKDRQKSRARAPPPPPPQFLSARERSGTELGGDIEVVHTNALQVPLPGRYTVNRRSGQVSAPPSRSRGSQASEVSSSHASTEEREDEPLAALPASMFRPAAFTVDPESDTEASASPPRPDSMPVGNSVHFSAEAAPSPPAPSGASSTSSASTSTSYLPPSQYPPRLPTHGPQAHTSPPAGLSVLDEHWSGSASIGTFHVLETARALFGTYEPDSGRVLRAAGYTSAYWAMRTRNVVAEAPVGV